MGLRVFISSNNGDIKILLRHCGRCLIQVHTKQHRVTGILDSLKIEFSVVDISAPGMDKLRIFMKEKSKKRAGERFPKPPQIFNDDHYCGDYEDFDLANEEGRLPPFLGIILKNEASPHIENPSFIRIYEQRIELSEIVTPVIKCEETFWNETFENIIEDPSIENIKNIEIFMIEVTPLILDEEKIIEESKLEIIPQIREIISCPKSLQNPNSFPKTREENCLSFKEREAWRGARDEGNESVPVRKRSGPILNSVQLMLNAGTLYNMNY